MSGIVNVSGANSPKNIYVSKDALESVNTSNDGQKIVKLKNGIIFNFYPQDLVEDKNQFGLVEVGEGYTGFSCIKVKDDSWCGLNIQGTKGDDKITVNDCTNVNVEAKGGNDLFVITNSESTKINTTGGGTGTIFGKYSGVIYDDKTETKHIPNGLIFYPKSDL